MQSMVRSKVKVFQSKRSGFSVISPGPEACNCGGIRWPFQSGNGLNYILTMLLMKA